MHDTEIGIVVQGDVRSATLPALAKLRQLYPGARLVLSTYASPALERDRVDLATLADQIVISTDPGSLPPTIISPTAPANNINRQIVSTSAGLAVLRTPFALKLRSDIILGARGIEAAWERAFLETGIAERLAAFSIYTRHPRGINGYLFHLSDWMMFGRTDELRRYWSASLMPDCAASFYERERHGWSETPTARRFRARFTPEQWLCRQYAAPLGYAVPDRLADRSSVLVAACERFLAERCLIVDPAAVAADLREHRGALRSRFQRLDCVSHADWRALVAAQRDGRTAPVSLARQLARALRHAISAEILIEKTLKRRLDACRAGAPRIRAGENQCSTSSFPWPAPAAGSPKPVTGTPSH